MKKLNMNLNMNLTHLALAVAALGMTTAHAADLPNLTASGIPAGNQVFIAGSSALTGSLITVMTSYCNAHGGVVTTNSCGSAGVAMRCITGGPIEPYAVVVKRDDSSLAGVVNTVNATPITGWCDTTGLNTTHAIAPDGALSDVNVDVFEGLANTGEIAPFTLNHTSYIAAVGFAGQGFGVMTSDPMYRAMQAVQVNDGRLPASCSTIAPPGATPASVAAVDPTNLFTPGACQPSISKEEYSTIVDGSNFAYINSPALTGTTDPINLCRRVGTSGTQASSSIYFLNNSCANANPTKGFKPTKKVVFPINGGNGVTLTSTSSTSATGNYEEFPGAFSIFEGSATGDVRVCISNRSLGRDPDDTADATLGNYAIGVLSLENSSATGRRFVKLDGVSPNAIQVPGGWAVDTTNRLNVIRGYYDFSREFVMVWNLYTVHTGTLEQIMYTFADPNAVNLTGVFQLNNGWYHYPPLTHATHPTKVHKGTRGGNGCAPMVLTE